jgi:hypothetical protein
MPTKKDWLYIQVFVYLLGKRENVVTSEALEPEGNWIKKDILCK